MEPYVTRFGGAVKSLGQNKIGGRVVTFSGHADPDLQREFFDGATDFWFNGPERRPILYRHGVDSKLKRRRLGELQISKSADGLWGTGYLYANDEDSRKLLAMAEQGQLNWSTGSVGHLVATSPVGKAKHIDEWPIAECSLCPLNMVAEPRNILSLKSFITFDETPPFDALEVSGVSPLPEFAVEHQKQLERRAAEIHAQVLMRQHELRMREIERSVYSDSKHEEQAYYGALAQLEIEKFNRMMNKR
jgi:hypothetical protein